MITEEQILSEFTYRCPRQTQYQIFRHAVEWAQYRMYVETERQKRLEQKESGE